MAEFILTVDGHPLVVNPDLQLESWDYTPPDPPEPGTDADTYTDTYRETY